ncbi:hypothetical protein MYX82_02255, partial [Acidobacteria bacterium AH-259-D05]|nr:hypothetical protein [Acidobacteria bacterium AH-259-D05]
CRSTPETAFVANFSTSKIMTRKNQDSPFRVKIISQQAACAPSQAGRQKGAVVLAAHGSGRESRAKTIVQAHARRLEREYGFQEVAVAFRQGSPSFAEVIDSIAMDDITVVPFFASNGHYSRTVLPRELSLNRRYSQVRLRFTQPVGTHPQMAILVSNRVREIVHRFHLRSEQTAVIVVGHGTRRHAMSSTSTLEMVESLKRSRVCSRIHPAFLDEPPQLEEVFQNLSQVEVVVVPFFIGGSYHVLQDIPRRLKLAELVRAQFPAQGVLGKRRVVFDRAIGTDPGITSILAQLAGRLPTLRRGEA